jgi:hypothetical protein
MAAESEAYIPSVSLRSVRHDCVELLIRLTTVFKSDDRILSTFVISAFHIRFILSIPSGHRLDTSGALPVSSYTLGARWGRQS